MSLNLVAYGAVAAAAAVLLVIGGPGQRAAHLPVPLLRVASAQAAGDGSGHAGPTQVSVAGTTLTSVSVELPRSTQVFPGGAAANAINANCLTCHSAGMVLNQPSLSRAVWEAEVAKMRNTYKAPVAAEDVSAIVAYLVGIKGTR